MNIRTPLSVLAFVAIAAPLSAHADGPSGEYFELFATPSSKVETKAETKMSDRAEHRNYAEFTYWDMAGEADSDRVALTREDVRREIASAPLPKVEA